VLGDRVQLSSNCHFLVVNVKIIQESVFNLLQSNSFTFRALTFQNGKRAADICDNHEIQFVFKKINPLTEFIPKHVYNFPH
jgi:hypothetical protein